MDVFACRSELAHARGAIAHGGEALETKMPMLAEVFQIMLSTRGIATYTLVLSTRVRATQYKEQ